MKSLSQTVRSKKSDALVAQKSSRQLGALKFGNRKTVEMKIQGRQVTLPVLVVKIAQQALKVMAQGKTVALLAQEEELSPREAADLLNVSRPFAAKLFDKGMIPSRKVGTHRRAHAKDVLAYKEKVDGQRNRTLDELVAQAQELNMGY